MELSGAWFKNHLSLPAPLPSDLEIIYGFSPEMLPEVFTDAIIVNLS